MQVTNQFQTQQGVAKTNRTASIDSLVGKKTSITGKLQYAPPKMGIPGNKNPTGLYMMKNGTRVFLTIHRQTLVMARVNVGDRVKVTGTLIKELRTPIETPSKKVIVYKIDQPGISKAK